MYVTHDCVDISYVLYETFESLLNALRIT